MNGTKILVAWLGHLGETRTARPTGAPLPFRTVRRIGGGRDGLTDRGVYSVSTFAATETEAAAEGMNTHQRISLLVGPGGQVPVTLASGAVYVDGVTVIDGPITTKWTDAIWRSVATYQVDLRSV